MREGERERGFFGRTSRHGTGRGCLVPKGQAVDLPFTFLKRMMMLAHVEFIIIYAGRGRNNKG